MHLNLPDLNYSMLVGALVDFVLERFAMTLNHPNCHAVLRCAEGHLCLDRSQRLNVWHFGLERLTQQLSEFEIEVEFVALVLVAMSMIFLRALFSRSTLANLGHCYWYLIVINK